MKKDSLIAGVLSFLVGCAIVALLVNFRKEVNNEPLCPVPTVTPEPTNSPSDFFELERKNREQEIIRMEDVSWYGQEYCDQYNPICLTASGEKFDENAFTCACSYRYALGSNIRFSYQGNSVVARCTDRGSFEKYNRVADLSRAAFQALSPLSAGVIKVKIEVIKN